MNNDFKNSIITDLENKEVSIVENTIFLCSQGYVVNKSKKIKLDWTSILLHAFDNINIFNKETRDKIEQLYNKLFV